MNNGDSFLPHPITQIHIYGRFIVAKSDGLNYLSKKLIRPAQDTRDWSKAPTA